MSPGGIRYFRKSNLDSDDSEAFKPGTLVYRNAPDCATGAIFLQYRMMCTSVVEPFRFKDLTFVDSHKQTTSTAILYGVLYTYTYYCSVVIKTDSI